MHLWTWQDRAFDLADRTQKVRSQEFSVYTTHPQLDPDMKDKHKRAYEKLFERLGTDQLIWCFHEYEDAASGASIAEFETLGRVLWEIDVPSERIKWHCHAAWTCLRTGKPGLPDRMCQICRFSEPEHAKKFQDEFTAYWGAKNANDLLNLMFISRPENGCSNAIVLHLVGTIVKNPLLLGTWWSKQRSHPTGQTRHDHVLLPCLSCPARDSG